VQLDIPAQLAAARACAENGRRADAIAAYARLLRDAPGTLDAMLPLAGLFVAERNLAFARSVLLEAASLHSERADVWALLANVLVDLDEPAAARTAYERALQVDPDLTVAHLGLAVLGERAGDAEAARPHWQRGYARGVTAGPNWHAPGVTRILLVSSAVGGNVPLLPILDDRRFVRAEIFAEGYTPAIPLPHDALIVNAIGDAERSGRALDAADRIIADLAGHVVNAPGRVRATTRVANAARLATIDGVVAPRVRAFAHQQLTGPGGAELLAAAGFAFPLLLRAPGFHTGMYFVQVENADALAGAAAQLPGPTLLAMEFVDTAAADGTYRKYRVLGIDGALYPLHLAVSRSWKVHYFSAAMGESEHYREEERAFLDAPRAAIGAGAYAALERVVDALGLDYGGVDFGLDATGRLVVFEANATMLIAPIDADPRFAYRRHAFAAATEAARAMLVARRPA